MRRAETATTSTCADALGVSSAAPTYKPARQDYFQLSDKWVPKQEALRIKCQADDARRCGERRHLYVTERPSAERQRIIARYLAKRGYECRYEQQVACDARTCARLHNGIAVYW
ncbi:hypothetical protein psal_cds_1288 [Pandoravirus salinus]|uniref:Uncharacterized protein n=1 Tax=Pandoravirus salinus TaxID=1349410 RepID=S4W4L1_9VIRU|nr:hypothetical protein psal_cds_1288 [Pandoravirus salinus]AGO85652.2 hypothetical protein psal_cds_1288 [Pandoravirus salinus]